MKQEQLQLFEAKKSRKTREDALNRASRMVLKAGYNILVYKNTKYRDIERELGGSSMLYSPEIVKQVEQEIKDRMLPIVAEIAQTWANLAQDRREAYKAKEDEQNDAAYRAELQAICDKYGKENPLKH